MKSISEKVAAAIILIAISGSALAEDAGVYFGGGLGVSEATITADNSTASGDTYSSAAFRILAGFAFSKHFAIEAEYVDLGSFTDVDQSNVSMDNSGLGVAAKGAITLPKDFSIFGKLGVATITTKYTVPPGWILNIPQTQTKTDISVSIGGEYSITKNAIVRASIDSYAVGTQGLVGRVATIGATGIYKF